MDLFIERESDVQMYSAAKNRGMRTNMTMLTMTVDAVWDWIDLNRTIEMAAMWKIMTITTRVEW